MPKYLISAGPGFTPFSYEELVRPLANMTAAQQTAQENLSILSDRSAGLEQYVDDDYTKGILGSYQQQLRDAENLMWEKGYNASTARNLASARKTYNDKIVGLARAAQAREQRSAEFWKMAHDHPDAILGEDPGKASLENYYLNPEYGKDWYYYSGDSFAAEVGSEIKSAAAGLLSDPEATKVPGLIGYLRYFEANGPTNEQVDEAGKLVLAHIKDPSVPIKSDDYGTQLIAEILMRRIDSTGVREKAPGQLMKMFAYGMIGARSGVKEPKSELLSDLEWKYQKELDNELAKLRAKPKSSGTDTSEALGFIPAPNLLTVTGASHDAAAKITSNEPVTVPMPNDNGDTVLKQFNNVDEKTEMAMSVPVREHARKLLGGIDPGADPVNLIGAQGSRQYGSFKDDKGVSVKQTRTVAGNGLTNTNIKVQSRTRNADGTWSKWTDDDPLTEIYNKARSIYKQNRKAAPKEIRDAALSPREAKKFREDNNIPDTVRDDQLDAYINDHPMQFAVRDTNAYDIANGTDNEDILEKALANLVASFKKVPGAKEQKKGTRIGKLNRAGGSDSGTLTELDPETLLPTKNKAEGTTKGVGPIKYNDTSHKYNIGNITNVQISAETLARGQVLLRTKDNKLFATGVGSLGTELTSALNENVLPYVAQAARLDALAIPGARVTWKEFIKAAIDYSYNANDAKDDAVYEAVKRAIGGKNASNVELSWFDPDNVEYTIPAINMWLQTSFIPTVLSNYSATTPKSRGKTGDTVDK